MRQKALVSSPDREILQRLYKTEGKLIALEMIVSQFTSICAPHNLDTVRAVARLSANQMAEVVARVESRQSVILQAVVDQLLNYSKGGIEVEPNAQGLRVISGGKVET